MQARFESDDSIFERQQWNLLTARELIVLQLRFFHAHWFSQPQFRAADASYFQSPSCKIQSRQRPKEAINDKANGREIDMTNQEHQ